MRARLPTAVAALLRALTSAVTSYRGPTVGRGRAAADVVHACAPTAACSATAASTPARRCCCGRRRRCRRQRHRASTSAAATGPIAVTMALRSPGLDGVGRRRQRAGARAVRGQRGGRRRRQRSRGRRRTSVPADVRFDVIWSNPADPHRQGRAPRAADDVARPPRHRTATPCSSSRSTSAPTRCSAGSAQGWPTSRAASRQGLPPPSHPSECLSASECFVRGPPARNTRMTRTRRPLLARRVDLDAEAGALGAGGGVDRLTQRRPRRGAGGPATLAAADVDAVDRRAARRPRRRCRRPRSRRGRRTAAARAAGGGPARARPGGPGSASSAAWTTSWRGRNVCTSSRPPCAATAGQPGAADEQRHRLLGGPVARRQQLGVDVEEGDDVGASDAVQHGLGADVDPGRRPAARRRRPVTATTGRPAAASSSSRSRVTPGTQVGERRRAALQAHRRAHGAAAPAHQRAVVGEPDRRVAHRAAGQRPAAAAGQDPGPARRVVHAHDGARRTRRWAISGDVTSDVFHGSSRLRSTTLDDRPAGALLVDRRAHQPVADAASPLTVGHGDTSSTGTPARRARSTATSRACHVGLRSSCSASSCSSMTTIAASVGARRPRRGPRPDHDVDAAAAAAHSCGQQRPR